MVSKHEKSEKEIKRTRISAKSPSETSVNFAPCVFGITNYIPKPNPNGPLISRVHCLSSPSPPTIAFRYCILEDQGQGLWDKGQGKESSAIRRKGEDKR